MSKVTSIDPDDRFYKRGADASSAQELRALVSEIEQRQQQLVKQIPLLARA